jgi:hypothetical protein
VIARCAVVLGLVFSGRSDEARFLGAGLVAAAEATSNPSSLAMALLVCGMASRFADPQHAMGTLRRALVVARDCGNRQWERLCATCSADLEAEHGDPHTAFDLYAETIRGYHDAGDTLSARSPMAGLAVFFDRVGHYEPAATIAGYATNPFTTIDNPELAAMAERLRDALGAVRYHALTTTGSAMAADDAVRYVLAEIEAARGVLWLRRRGS